MEVLVSSNVFAVFVLVRLVVGVVHIPISEEKKLGLMKVIDGPDISILTIKFGECTLKMVLEVLRKMLYFSLTLYGYTFMNFLDF